MRRSLSRGPGLLALLVLGVAVPARAQLPGIEPKPYFDNVQDRSGLIYRFVPIEPWLPPDPYRDTFYDTRFADSPDARPNHPNMIRGGGLYGRRWPGYCTVSFYPFFFGSSGGQNLTGPACKPPHRLLKGPQTFLTQFRPLRPFCYYYDQGSYVPMYDLDPIVPGPGPVPYFFPFYLKYPHGG